MTDHDWQIQYMSADAKLLGAKGSELRGFPLLGLIHPSAASEFLAAASRSAADRLAVTLRTRMRAGPDRWADRYCFLAPICEHQPPRLGVVISEGPSASADVQVSSLDEQVHQCALEARASRPCRLLKPTSFSRTAANYQPASPRSWLGSSMASASPRSLARCS